MRKIVPVLFLLLSLGAGARGAAQEAASDTSGPETNGPDASEANSNEPDAGESGAKENDINWDLDSYFDHAPEETYSEPQEIPDNGPINLRDKITVDIDYGFVAGVSPGWTEAPWLKDVERETDYVLGAKMRALLSLDIPLTDHLKVHNVFSFTVPSAEFFYIEEFYFEYDFFSRAYLQAGLYETAWGISRFYPFTNLPAMVPQSDKSPGDSYIARLTFPIGIGGLELLGMTRYGYISDVSSPSFDEIAFGMKYNLALSAADIDMGMMYHKKLPVRSFVSVKTTLGNTELYSEGLVAVNQEENPDIYISGNVGFLRDFFDSDLTLTGELYYNGEPNAAWWREESDLLEEDTVDLFPGLNAALAFIIRPGVLGMRVFAKALYSYERESVWLVPGISINPGDITITLSTPVALGSRADNTYYRNNEDRSDRPFSVVLGISFNGKLRYAF